MGFPIILGSTPIFSFQHPHHQIQGTTPPVDGAFSPTGHLASFDLETIPATPMVKGTTHVTTLEMSDNCRENRKRFDIC